MKKKDFLQFLFVLTLFISSCTVTLITGYDNIVDETSTKLKKDFNLFFIKLSRALCTQDAAADQKAFNYQEYYDHMEVDLRTIKDRSIFLGTKSKIVKDQIKNLDSLMHAFKKMHESGFQDIDCNASVKDDKHDLSNAVNLSIDAVLKLQEELKATGKINSNN